MSNASEDRQLSYMGFGKERNSGVSVLPLAGRALSQDMTVASLSRSQAVVLPTEANTTMRRTQNPSIRIHKSPFAS